MTVRLRNVEECYLLFATLSFCFLRYCENTTSCATVQILFTGNACPVWFDVFIFVVYATPGSFLLRSKLITRLSHFSKRVAAAFLSAFVRQSSFFTMKTSYSYTMIRTLTNSKYLQLIFFAVECGDV